MEGCKHAPSHLSASRRRGDLDEPHSLEPPVSTTVSRTQRRSQFLGESRCQRVVERASEKLALREGRLGEPVVQSDRGEMRSNQTGPDPSPERRPTSAHGDRDDLVKEVRGDDDSRDPVSVIP